MSLESIAQLILLFLCRQLEICLINISVAKNYKFTAPEIIASKEVSTNKGMKFSTSVLELPVMSDQICDTSCAYSHGE